MYSLIAFSCRKLGLSEYSDEVEILWNDLGSLMFSVEADYTILFRLLSRIRGSISDIDTYDILAQAFYVVNLRAFPGGIS